MIVATGVLAIIFTSGFQVFRLSLKVVDRAQNYTKAEIIARDLVELTVSKRNEDWNSLAPGQYYFLEDPIEGFVFTSGTESIGIFDRYITISEVERDGNGQIVTTGGTVDPNTFKAVANVGWATSGKDFEVELVQYLTNWRRF